MTVSDFFEYNQNLPKTSVNIEGILLFCTGKLLQDGELEIGPSFEIIREVYPVFEEFFYLVDMTDIDTYIERLESVGYDVRVNDMQDCSIQVCDEKIIPLMMSTGYLPYIGSRFILKVPVQLMADIYAVESEEFQIGLFNVTPIFNVRRKHANLGPVTIK